jgi:hypothetical protein
MYRPISESDWTRTPSRPSLTRSKIESFIRSKYESKRWAMDGPPPSDPSVLEQGGGSQAQAVSFCTICTENPG